MAYTFVQSKSAGGSGTGPTLTYNAAPTKNNLLVCSVYSASNTAIGMSSTGWTALTSIATGSGGSQVAFRMFWKTALAGESSTITATSGSNSWAICAAEYSCLGKAIILTKENAQNNASGTSQPTPSVTPVTGSEILVVCSSGVRFAGTSFSSETIGGIAIGSGVTEREDVNQAVNAANLCLYDLFLDTPVNSYSGGATASNAAVGAGGITIFTFVYPPENNYKFVTSSSAGVISVTEKIR